MDKHTPKERRNERIEEVILEVGVQYYYIIIIVINIFLEMITPEAGGACIYK